MKFKPMMMQIYTLKHIRRSDDQEEIIRVSGNQERNLILWYSGILPPDILVF